MQNGNVYCVTESRCQKLGVDPLWNLLINIGLIHPIEQLESYLQFGDGTWCRFAVESILVSVNEVAFQAPKQQFLQFCLANIFVVLIYNPKLNWISDRKLEKLESSPCYLHAIVLYELLLTFSE